MGDWFVKGICIIAALATNLSQVRGNPLPMSSDEGQSAFAMIEKVNRHVKHDLFESDISFSPTVQEALGRSKEDQPPIGVAMDAVRNREYLWITRTVPYQLTNDFSKAEKDIIIKTMRIIEEKSCIRFKRRTKETNWVQIIKDGGGCFSSVGKEYWKIGKQIMSLSDGCLSTSIVLHELLHLLGFWHEQSRPDRDKYVEIFWENIEEDAEKNFEKYSHEEADLLGLPYDYQSVMHYEKTSGSKNGKPTILAIGNKSQELGKSKTLTPIDIIQINRLYDCSAPGAVRDRYVSNWSNYGPCDNHCRKTRQRFCSHPDLTKCPKVNANGIEEQVATCTVSECNAPVDGHWSRWSSWNDCAPDCGPRKRTRTRYCTQQKNGGKQCVGEAVQSFQCRPKICGVPCSFDTNWCGWRNGHHNLQRFKWWTGIIDTPSKNTGPSRDHTSGKGKYLFVEASKPSQEGDKARLVSRTRNATGLHCLSFWYHMYGANMGSLRVFLKFSNGTEDIVWEETGDKGNKWMHANFTVDGPSPYQVIFEAERGNGFGGDIAIDDTNIKVGKCGIKNLETLIGIPIKALGCYGDSMSNRAMSNLIGYNRHLIQWQRFKTSLVKILRLCAEKAKSKGHKYFGLQFYGECWSSSHEIAPFRYGPSTACVDGKFKECVMSNDVPCTGKANANFIYKFIDNNDFKPSV